MRTSSTNVTPAVGHPDVKPVDAASQAARLLHQALELLGSNGVTALLSQAAPPTERLIRLPEVKRLTGLGRTAIYVHMRDKRFPKSVKAGPRIAAWRESAIQAWIAERVERQP